MLRLLYTSIWLCSLGVGALWMANYSTAPGKTGNLISEWPASSSIEKRSGTEMLLVYVHPHCPCSHATIRELMKLRAGCPKLQICVCCFCPDNADSDWPIGRLYHVAESLSRHAPVHDHGGVEAERFGILTSGHVMLFDETGLLRFSGGVTSGRGHEGSNPGLAQLQESLKASNADNPPTGTSSFPVFGCSIRKGVN